MVAQERWVGSGGANNDRVQYPATNTVPTAAPPPGVDTVQLPDGRRFEWTGTAWAPIASSCPGPMTRAALLALRAAGTLNTACHYVVTDYAEGRFLAGTTLTLHAVAPNELSEEVWLNSLYDNEAWEARYDIDRNTLIECSDNLGNVVRSNTTGRVASWDWGNVNVFNNTSDGALITWTYGAPRPVAGNRFGAAATVAFTGWIGGSFADNEVSGASVVDMTNANASVLQSRILSGATLNLSRYTGGGTAAYRTTIENGATVVFANSTVTHALSGCTVSGTVTTITSQNVTTAGATLSMTGSEVAFGGRISRNASVSAMSANYSRILGSDSNVTQSRGVLAMTGTSLQDYGRILMDGASGTVGQCTVNYSTISGNGSYVRHWGTGPMSISGLHMSAGSNVNTAAGSNMSTSITNVAISAGAINVNAGSTAGNLTVTSTNIASGGFITKDGRGSLAVSSTTLVGTGRITQAVNNVRNLTVTGCMCTNVGRIQQGATAGAGVTDSIIYSSVQDYGIVNFTATGAAGNAVNYCSVRGLTGSIAYNGTNAGGALSRTTVDNGNVTFTSNVAMPTILDIGVRDQGAWTVQGCTAARDIRYSTVQSYGRWVFNACTAAGQTFGIDVSAQGNLTHSAAARSMLYGHVQTSTVNHNGGNTTGLRKGPGGALTTGAFNHQNIIHESATAKTLTANNTNRADYMGLAPQLT